MLVGEQLFQHLELLLAGIQACRQFVQRRHERRRGIGAALQRFVDAALADAQGEVELVGVDVGQLGETFAEGIQPNQTRLQFAEMHTQCVHLPLRVLAGAADLGALRLQRGIDFDAGHRSRRAEQPGAHEAPGQQAGTDHAGPGQHQQPRLQMDGASGPMVPAQKNDVHDLSFIRAGSSETLSATIPTQ